MHLLCVLLPERPAQAAVRDGRSAGAHGHDPAVGGGPWEAHDHAVRRRHTITPFVDGTRPLNAEQNDIDMTAHLQSYLMDIALAAEEYVPGINDTGTYVDQLPGHRELSAGITCPCRTRRIPSSFSAPQSLKAHWKTKAHRRWLSELNAQKMNYYKRCRELEKTVEMQRKMLAQQAQRPNVPTGDLLGL